MSEKTELPSAQRLRKAREDGQFARSRMLASGAALAAGLIALMVTGGEGAARLQAWTTSLFLRQTADVRAAALEGLLILAWLVGPAAGAAFAAAFATSAAFAGLQLNVQHVSPKLERLNPADGFKKLFKARQLLDTAKNLVIALVVAWIVWGAVRDGAADAFRAVLLEGSGGVLAILALLRPMVLQLCAVILVIGGLDYLLERHRHIKDLMMTREEVKQEYKNSEGDPHSKAKRKALHKSLASAGPARGVHKATAVVVNPTHIAVALRYDPDECEAPYLVAKGREADAFAIRREAKRLGIPVVKDIPLARSLIHYDVGEEVPEELYRAAAAVIKAATEEKESDASPRSRTP